MRGITFSLEVPYFACFRKPLSTSSLLTFPVPPPSTVFGLILNALGVNREGYLEGIEKLQATLRINICPIAPLERPTRELAKMLKLIEREVERRPGLFPSSPIFKELLVRPSYEVFLASEDDSLMQEVTDALRSPERPLYLGQSDDMVVVEVLWEGEVRSTHVRELWGLVRGVHEGCEVLRLPFGFERDSVLYLPLTSLPKKPPLRLVELREAYSFGEKTVELFGIEYVDRQAAGEGPSDFRGSHY